MKSMNCRKGCGTSFIAPSISSNIAGMPNGYILANAVFTEEMKGWSFVIKTMTQKNSV